jgi:hypothetical protein
MPQSQGGSLSARPEHVATKRGSALGREKGSGAPRVWEKWRGLSVYVVFRYGAVELDRPVRVVHAPVYFQS